MKQSIRSTLILLLAALIWGLAFVAQKVAADTIGSLAFNGIRFLLGSLSLVPVWLIMERKVLRKIAPRRILLPGFLCGTVLFIAATLQQYGVLLTDTTGKSGFITGLYTVLVPIAGVVFFHRKQRSGTWIAAGLAVVGLFLLCMSDRITPTLGDALLFSGTLFWTAHIILIDRLDDKIPRLCFCSIQFFVCGSFSLIGSFLFETVTWHAISATLIPILYGGILSVGVAYTLQVVGQRNCNPALASIVLSLESVFGALGGIVILDDTMKPRGWIGCVLIFLSILIAQSPDRPIHHHRRRRKKRHERA